MKIKKITAVVHLIHQVHYFILLDVTSTLPAREKEEEGDGRRLAGCCGGEGAHLPVSPVWLVRWTLGAESLSS